MENLQNSEEEDLQWPTVKITRKDELWSAYLDEEIQQLTKSTKTGFTTWIIHFTLMLPQ